jgi:hypothetical protein
MNPIFAAALEVQDFCRERHWRFCFIGGVAVQRWGEPRLTQDVDLTLLTGFGTEEAFVSALLDRFPARRDDARAFALRHRVVLAHTETGIPLDISLGAMPFEERAVGRASDFTISPDVSLFTCGAEDLIVFKTFAGRDRDWLDIEGIATRRAGRLDEALIWTELAPLLELKEDQLSGERLRHVLKKARD